MTDIHHEQDYNNSEKILSFSVDECIFIVFIKQITFTTYLKF